MSYQSGWPAKARSEPVLLTYRDSHHHMWNGNRKVVYFYANGRSLIYRMISSLERENLDRIQHVLEHPVPIILLAEWMDDSPAFVRGELYAEIMHPFRKPESVLLPLGLAHRSERNCRFPEDPQRETRDFLLSMLQGPSERRIKELLTEVQS